jgi:hypothetical protein
MKSLLIILFIALFTYLVLYICGIPGNPARHPKSAGRNNGNLAAAMSRLTRITDRELLLLKDDLIALRKILDRPISSSEISDPVSSWRKTNIGRSSVVGMIRLYSKGKNPADREGIMGQVMRYQLFIIQSTLILMVIALMWI